MSFFVSIESSFFFCSRHDYTRSACAALLLLSSNTFEFYTVNGNEKIEHMVITVTGWNVNDGSCRRIGVRTFFCFVLNTNSNALRKPRRSNETRKHENSKTQKHIRTGR